MKQHQKKLRSGLLVFALFFSAFTLAFGDVVVSFDNREQEQVLGVQDDVKKNDNSNEQKPLNLSSNITSVNETDSNEFEVSYNFSIQNTTDKTINDIVINADFRGTFPSNKFKIIELTSNNLEINSSFNGLSDTEIIKEIKSLPAQNSASVNLVVSFDPGNDSGPFVNNIKASGLLDGKKVEDSSKSSNENKDSDNKKDEDKNNKQDNDKKNDTSEKKDPPLEPVETNLDPRDIRFFLVDIETNEEIIEITNGDIIDFSEIEYRPFTLVTKVTPGTKGSVKFGINEKDNYRVENQVPYAVAHNGTNMYEEWRAEPGEYSVTATVYTMRKAKGEVIESKNIKFEMINYELLPLPKKEDQKESSNNSTEVTSDSTSSSFTIELNKESGSIEGDQDVPVFEEVIIEDDEGNIIGTETKKNRGDFGELVFNNPDLIEPGRVLSISIEEELEPEVVEVSNPFEESNSSGSVAGANTTANEGRVLAATGINVTKSVMIGTILLLAVVELNLIRAEKKFFTKIVKS